LKCAGGDNEVSKRRRNANDDIARSLFGAGLLGVLTACLILVPLDDETRVTLGAALGPTIALVTFIVYRVWDRWDRRP
jgi:hypothetical protein